MFGEDEVNLSDPALGDRAEEILEQALRGRLGAADGRRHSSAVRRFDVALAA